jgi:hypothetical protein
MMAFETHITDDLVRIARAGGGFRLNASARKTEDLILIASAAKNGECNVVLIGMNARISEDIVKIAEAGRGHISFED